MNAQQIDTANKFMVGVQGQTIRVMRPNMTTGMSKAEALNLAAWLVALADDGDQFPAVLEAVQNI